MSAKSLLFILKIRVNSEILSSLGALVVMFFFYIYEDDNDGDDVFDHYENDGDDGALCLQEAHAGGKALKDAGYKFDVAHTSVLQVTYLVFSSFFFWHVLISKILLSSVLPG